MVAFIGAVTLLAVAVRGAPLPEFWEGGSAGFFQLLFEVLPFVVLGFVGLAVYAGMARRGVGPEGEGSGRPPSFEDRMRAGLPLAVILVATVILTVLSAGRMQPAADREQEASRMDVAAEGIFRTPFGMSRWFDMEVMASDPAADEEDGAGEGATARGIGISLRTGVLILVAVLVATALWHRYGRKKEAEEDPLPLDPERAAMEGAVHAGIEAMLVDPDPNTAIRGAYAQLLFALEDFGQGRWEHEGPTEHLQRVLAALRIHPAPLRELISLFELARFSHLDLSASHRDQALRALQAVAVGLEEGR